MPLDPFFGSKWKSKARPSRTMSAVRKRMWPTGSQFKPVKKREKKVGLEMRHPKDLPKWLHVIDVAESKAEEEMKEWLEQNPGWQFRLQGVTHPHEDEAEGKATKGMR